MTGATTSTAILAGILGARETGKGRDIDETLFEVAMYRPERQPWPCRIGRETTAIAYRRARFALSRAVEMNYWTT